MGCGQREEPHIKSKGSLSVKQEEPVPQMEATGSLLADFLPAQSEVSVLVFPGLQLIG